MSAGSFTVHATTLTPNSRATASARGSRSWKFGDQMAPFASCTILGTASPFFPEVR